MPITYTNRKGFTYYLGRTLTKTGKPRYIFARTPKSEPVEELPEGLLISESVNGTVSLVRDVPALIRAEELAAVQGLLAQHPQPTSYRAVVKANRIDIYERAGTNSEELTPFFARLFPDQSAVAEHLREERERYSRFSAVLRFVLRDAEQRRFAVQRWCYLGRIDGWIEVGLEGPIETLARQSVPRLGNDTFYEYGWGDKCNRSEGKCFAKVKGKR